MVVERIENEIIVRISSSVNFEELQRFIDLMRYKEATAGSEAKQKDIDKIAKEANQGWWKKNRAHFIQ